MAHYRFQFLSAGFESGLFEALAKQPGMTKAEIGAKLGLAEQPTRVLLLGLTAFGLTSKAGDAYRNTAVVTPLTGDNDPIAAALVPYHQHITYKTMGWFWESLKANTNVGLKKVFGDESTTLYERIAADPTLESAFHNAMGAFSAMSSTELVKTLDFSSYTHVLDIGGGRAINATNIARRWPHLRITILDLPTVAKTANERLVAAGLDDRVKAVGLDAFSDEFPTGADCVLFSHFLEIWSEERIRKLLQKASRAVGDGAGIFVVTPLQDDDETGPQHAAELSAYFHAVASGEGMVYTPREYEEWMSEAGFRPAGRTPVGELINHIAISGVKGGA
ncbi:methyltransferase domain-containing protein [Solihabitans fulvus]|uniref:Methyltransferase domain-containing protein n=2 Tax=Solihabitans fulvus TaxID=1892852 RepID=A0A5B2XHT2_9PSEU|nr:methyltransferase domain-containing protein [Solihabitans fulvus]